MYIGQVLLSSRPFLVAISCFHPLSGGDAQARNAVGITPGILVRSGYGLSTGAENWKCVGLDSEQSDDDWAQFNFDDSDWFDPVIRADAGVSLVNQDQDQDTNNVWIWGKPESGEGVPQYTLCRLFVSSLEGESCLNYKRSLPICNDDGTPGLNYREQENFNTGYLDGSAIYGSTLKASHNLRLFEGGLLKHAPGGMCSDFLPKEKYLYLAGDSRVTSFPHLLAVHTLFLREHNRIAREIQRLTRYPDEKIYELARKLTIAELQSITVLDLLPMILGRTPEFMKQYTKYNPTVNAGVEQAIAAAVSGFIYTVIPPEVLTGGVDTSQYSSIRSGNLIDYFAGTKQYDYTCAPDQLLR
ncbi:peroxidasin-like protein [Eurytemora carolleeae]|uniref:peroxidasin-like protein n=1 Tax=Eurytemora carolleeae TaxID=1294199 RepID=UPI000C76FBCE|nr:peroxidasin-like protein [Eurytemora carolleeae]|eukprot:XP_023324729.1 peroxidasin-like protein [Eurytemora affinis]